mmetsp:Transcript_33474/g.56226  ORF Transcript_33474/g.56226 Transcript_33474/m.56226 type:complete len:216 (+) Transcript_33474:2231-2878(+)
MGLKLNFLARGTTTTVAARKVSTSEPKANNSPPSSILACVLTTRLPRPGSLHPFLVRTTANGQRIVGDDMLPHREFLAREVSHRPTAGCKAMARPLEMLWPNGPQTRRLLTEAPPIDLPVRLAGESLLSCAAEICTFLPLRAAQRPCPLKGSMSVMVVEVPPRLIRSSRSALASPYSNGRGTFPYLILWRQLYREGLTQRRTYIHTLNTPMKLIA